MIALVDRRLAWGEDRLFYYDEAGKLCRIPAQWTSMAAVDAFVQTSAGRSSLRVSDLLQLAVLIAQCKSTLKSKRSTRLGEKASIK